MVKKKDVIKICKYWTKHIEKFPSTPKGYCREDTEAVIRMIPSREKGHMDITDVEEYLRKFESHKFSKKQASAFRIIWITVITSIVTTLITILLTNYFS